MSRTRDLEQGYDEEVGNAGGGIRSPKDPIHFAGVTPQDIAAGATVTFALALNMDMNPRQIVIPDAWADLVCVTEAAIGPINLNAGDGPVPGSMFKSESTVRFSPAVASTTNQPLKIKVKNLSTAPIVGFFLGVVGSVKRAS